MSSDRKDAIVGEIVRVLVRADSAALARLYALAKEEEKAMNVHTDRSIGELFSQLDARKAKESDGKGRTGRQQAERQDGTDDERAARGD
jgi:hypothetical protein